VLTARAVGAQQPAEEYQFSEVIDVQLVNVEVWVTDGKGRPVRGLTADAFEVLEDGQPVEITYFAEIQGNRPVLTELEQVLAEPRPEAPPPPPSTPDGEPSHLVVYFDQLHLLPSSRRRAIEDLREFLLKREVAPERVLILSQDQNLTTEATFGSSWGELDEALSRLSKSLPRGGVAASEKRLAIRSLQDLWEWAVSTAQGGTVDAACDVFLPRAIPDVEVYAAESRQRIAVTLDHLTSTASFLTGVPGVKTLLFISDALERAPGVDLVGLIRDYCPVQQTSPMFLLSDELGREFRTLTRHANANRVTIYALQTEGLDFSFTGGAEQRSSPGFRGSIALDSAKRVSEREGMMILAGETGGRTIFNRNEFGPELSEIAREMSSYYSLAYEPTHAGDRREHEIRVRLKGKGLEARHRRGYRDKGSDAQMTERLQAAIYLGLVDNPLGVRLGAGAVRPAGEKNWLTVPLHILVPAESVVFLPTEDGVVAQLSVQVSTRRTMDQKGLFDHRAYRISWKTETDQEMVGVVMDLEVPPGVHLVAVGVRDDATREMSFVSTTVEVHPAAGGPQSG
jgi:VWFA-related protein